MHREVLMLVWSNCRQSCRVTNPHEFEVDGVSFLGTSGQNIDDVDRQGLPSIACHQLTISSHDIKPGSSLLAVDAHTPIMR